MTDHDTEERAAYQRAVELAKDEIARLRADLAGRDQHIAQQIAALEAERAARQIAEADNAALRRALDGTTRMMKERSDNNSRAWRWARAVAVANQQVLIDHPGAALLTDLGAARAVVAAMRQIDKHRVGAYETDQGSVEPCDECGEMREIAAQALAAYKEATKAREM